MRSHLRVTRSERWIMRRKKPAREIVARHMLGEITVVVGNKDDTDTVILPLINQRNNFGINSPGVYKCVVIIEVDRSVFVGEVKHCDE